MSKLKIAGETKFCAGCNTTKSVNDFYCREKPHKKLSWRCKSCISEIGKKYRANPVVAQRNRDRAKIWWHTGENSRNSSLKKYGISQKDYENLLILQNFKCAICEINQLDAQRRILCIDHNHTTEKVRGLLCVKCNAGLGAFADNLKLVNKAKEYLEKYAN